MSRRWVLSVLKPVRDRGTEQSILSTCLEAVESLLMLKDIDPHQHLAQLGLDSIGSAVKTVLIEMNNDDKFIGFEFTPELATTRYVLLACSDVFR